MKIIRNSGFATARAATVTVILIGSVLISSCDGLTDSDPPPEPASIHRVGAVPVKVARVGDQVRVSVVVLDIDDNPVAQAAVAWQVTQGGGALTNVDSVADGEGRASATWSLGAMADQSLKVISGDRSLTVPGHVEIAQVEFPFEILKTWRSDSTELSATALDADGTVLTANFQWTSMDPEIVQIEGHQAHARRHGTTTITATAQEQDYDLLAVVRPVISGRLVSLEGNLPDDLLLIGEQGSVSDTAHFKGNGSFDLRVRHLDLEAPFAPLALRLVVGGRDDQYHPIGIFESEVDTSITVALVPTKWIIRRGLYEGQEVTVSIHEAMVTPENGPSYYGSSYIRESQDYLVTLETISEEDFPRRVGFWRSVSNVPITAEDSVRFWERVEDMERVFGFDMFEPIVDPGWVSAAEGGLSTFRHRDLMVRVDSALGYAGLGGASCRSFRKDDRWERRGGSEPWYSGTHGFYRISECEIHDSGIALHSGVMRSSDSRVIQHELLHAIGLGHGCHWPSIQSSCKYGSRTITPHDVAHWELLHAVADLSRTVDAGGSIARAMVGQRVRAGLPAIPDYHQIRGQATTFALSDSKMGLSVVR